MCYALSACSGRQCALERGVNCCATVQATNLLRTLLTTMPRTSPSGFSSAVILPNLIACATSLGMFPRANCVVTSPQSSLHPPLSNTTFICSFVIPESPFFLDVLEFFKNKSTSNAKGFSGSTIQLCSSMCGLVVFVRNFRVTSFPGATPVILPIVLRNCYAVKKWSPRNISNPP